jgi:GTP cyclohydrolase II
MSTKTRCDFFPPLDFIPAHYNVFCSFRQHHRDIILGIDIMKDRGMNECPLVSNNKKYKFWNDYGIISCTWEKNNIFLYFKQPY